MTLMTCELFLVCSSYCIATSRMTMRMLSATRMLSTAKCTWIILAHQLGDIHSRLRRCQMGTPPPASWSHRDSLWYKRKSSRALWSASRGDVFSVPIAKLQRETMQATYIITSLDYTGGCVNLLCSGMFVMLTKLLKTNWLCSHQCPRSQCTW